MLNDFAGVNKLYIACGYTDLRRGDYGLVSIVQQKFGLLAPQQPYQNGLGYTDTLRVGAVSISINEGSSAKLL